MSGPRPRIMSWLATWLIAGVTGPAFEIELASDLSVHCRDGLVEVNAVPGLDVVEDLQLERVLILEGVINRVLINHADHD